MSPKPRARELGGIDILVNNDGAPPLGPVAGVSMTRRGRKAIEQNLMYVIRMVREVVPSMKARGGGSILNITAISAIQPIAGFSLSVATWSAVIGYAKTLSLEVARVRHQRQHDLPGVHRHVAAAEGVRGRQRRRRCREGPA